MKRARPLVALVIFLALIAVLAMPTQANAFISYYNCVAKPAHQWCDGRANGSFDGLHSWDWNEGWSNGGPSTYVCQRVWKPSSGGVLGSSCASSNWVGMYYGNVQCACYEAEVLHQASGTLNLFGFADADF